jgi:hypothetical protein
MTLNLALLKKSSTRHKFGKIWSILAIKNFFFKLNHLEVLSLFAFVVNHSK